jgi:hypothetical protein
MALAQFAPARIPNLTNAAPSVRIELPPKTITLLLSNKPGSVPPHHHSLTGPAEELDLPLSDGSGVLHVTER